MIPLRLTSKSLLASVLALVLILTNMSMAMGQIRAAAVGEMVLCTGHGPRIVQIDADGQPVEARTTCPDCLIGDVLPNTTIFAFATDMVFASSDLLRFETSAAPRLLRGHAHGTRAPPLA